MKNPALRSWAEERGGGGSGSGTPPGTQDLDFPCLQTALLGQGEQVRVPVYPSFVSPLAIRSPSARHPLADLSFRLFPPSVPVSLQLHSGCRHFYST